jgi:L-ascorbate metabolism protein UlaG (beta-lactamase superfamily)
MPSPLVYLRPDVAAEPLVCRWTAYEMMVAPHTLGMMLKSRLDLLASYTRFPANHLKARLDPALVGGPWVDYPTDRSTEAEALRREMMVRCARQLELAAGIKALDELLRSEALGGSLRPLYARIPDALRGYVELVYDLSHRPSIRFLEGLLYRGPLYDRSLQALSLSRLTQDRRPFVWTTPVFDEPHRVTAPLAFDDPSVDVVLGAASRAVPLGELADRLGVTAGRCAALDALVTTEPPVTRSARPDDGVRVRYFGHACVLVETRDVAILVDPFLGYELPSEVPRYTYGDLPERIDLVLITHAHNDHLELETLLRLRHRIGRVLVPRASGRSLQDPSLKLALQAIGFPRVDEVGDLEAIDVPAGRIVAIPFLGEHCDLDIQGKCAWRIELAGRSIMLAADAANVEPRVYEHVRRLLGEVDILFLGMECDGAPLSWSYGALLARPLGREPDRSRTASGSNHAEAAAMLEALRPSRFYVYAMGAEPWLHHVMVIPQDADSPRVRDPRRLVAEYRERGMEAAQLRGRKEVHLEAR